MHPEPNDASRRRPRTGLRARSDLNVDSSCTGWDCFPSVATPVARAQVGGRANRCGRVSRVQLRSGWRAPPGATPASHLPARVCRLPGCRRATHRLSVWAGACARDAMMPCVSLPLPPAATVAPLASVWGGGLLLLPSAAFAVARPRCGRLHAPAAAAAPHRLPVPVPAPVGGAGRGGETRGGRFKTAAELGWPLPTWGLQRPVLLAHPSRPPSVLMLPQHPDGHSAPLFLFSRCDAPCCQPYSPADDARPTASRGSRDLGTLASATNTACCSSLVARARHGASWPSRRLVFLSLVPLSVRFPQGRSTGQLVALGVLIWPSLENYKCHVPGVSVHLTLVTIRS